MTKKQIIVEYIKDFILHILVILVIFIIALCSIKGNVEVANPQYDGQAMARAYEMGCLMASRPLNDDKIAACKDLSSTYGAGL